MSLLMDALRKAEADKRAAAARARGETPPPEPPPAGFTIETNPELRLEPLAEDARDASTPGPTPEPTLSITGSTTGPRVGLGRFRSSAGGTAGDATLAEELPFDRLPGAAAGGTLARPELVTAQTVFAAGDRRRLPPTLAILGGVTLSLLAGLMALGYRYYAQAPPPVGIPSPRVALDVERAPPVVVPAPKVPPSPPVVPQAPPAPMPDASPSPDASPDPATAAGPPPPASAVADTPPAEAAATTAAVTPPESPPARPPPAPRDELEMRNGELRIARSGGGEEILRRQLTLAYAAFEHGDLAEARLAWETVLRRDPAQRDALLGLGALALAADRLDEAHRHYAAVLAGAPDHPVASAALFLIEGGRGARIGEAKLKTLLAAGRDAPYLSFALGNLYARDARWGDAQQAYFAAFSGQPRNADYAYNLAVSLDHLGQRTAAREYYAKAQALRNPTSRFDASAAAARIAALAMPAAGAPP